MSVSAVLERQPNVRDIGEVVTQPRNPWEMITPEQAIKGAHSFCEVTSILYPEIDVTPHFDMTLIPEGLGGESDFDDLDAFASYLAINNDIRFLKRDFTQGVSDTDQISKAVEMARKYKIRNTRNFDHDEFLRFAFGMRLNFPGIDISSKLSKYFEYYSFDKYLNDTHYFGVKNKLRLTAYLKLLYPEEAKTFDFTKTEIYKESEREFQDGGLFEEDLMVIAAYMKVLAAQDARIGSDGIELVMPPPIFPAFQSSIPEQGRFQA